MTQPRLAFRMVLSGLTLVVLTGLFLTGVWSVFLGLLALFSVSGAGWIATTITVGVLVAIGYAEFRQTGTIERLAGGRPVSPESEPELDQITTRVATQLDVPKPTVVIANREAPEAMVVGFRPGNTQLVISRGTLDALDSPAELEAVVAHELAHVANRDAMVMRAISTPVVLARGLLTRVQTIEQERNEDAKALVALTVPLAVISKTIWFLGTCVTAQLSRERELAADRAAVDVTGSPAALASALDALDEQITSTPTEDLREAGAVSSLSILPLEPEPEKVALGPDGNKEPSFWWLRKRIHSLFRTHPPTKNRIERLYEWE